MRDVVGSQCVLSQWSRLQVNEGRPLFRRRLAFVKIFRKELKPLDL